MDGETCTNWNRDNSELFCSFLSIPDCTDRTIYCSEPPMPERANITFPDRPNPYSNKEYGTSIEFSCPDPKHYFDYPVGADFVSHYYTTSQYINAMNVSCNRDG